MRLTDGNLIDMANKAAPHQDRDNDMFYIAMGRLVEAHYVSNAQHQGEPVALPSRLPVRMPQGRNLPRNYAEAWNACLDEIAKLGPLYTHADPGEVERLRALSVTNIMLDITPGEDGMGHEVYAKSVDDFVQKFSSMGERLENLEIWHGGFRELLRKIRPYLLSQEGIAAEIDAALSASAEPSAPAVHPVNMKTIMQAYEQVDHKTLLHGTSNWCAAMATALRGVLCAESSAPKEI